MPNTLSRLVAAVLTLCTWCDTGCLLSRRLIRAVSDWSGSRFANRATEEVRKRSALYIYVDLASVKLFLAEVGDWQ